MDGGDGGGRVHALSGRARSSFVACVIVEVPTVGSACCPSRHVGMGVDVGINCGCSCCIYTGAYVFGDREICFNNAFY